MKLIITILTLNERAEASDKDKRIEQLVEQMNAIRENFIEADTQVASLKSSLAEKENEIERLRKFVQHHINCAYEKNERWECDCGYQERLYGVR